MSNAGARGKYAPRQYETTCVTFPSVDPFTESIARSDNGGMPLVVKSVSPRRRTPAGSISSEMVDPLSADYCIVEAAWGYGTLLPYNESPHCKDTG